MPSLSCIHRHDQWGKKTYFRVDMILVHRWRIIVFAVLGAKVSNSFTSISNETWSRQPGKILSILVGQWIWPWVCVCVAVLEANSHLLRSDGCRYKDARISSQEETILFSVTHPVPLFIARLSFNSIWKLFRDEVPCPTLRPHSRRRRSST